MHPWTSDTPLRNSPTRLRLLAFACAFVVGLGLAATVPVARAAEPAPSEKALKAAAKALYDSGREHHLAGKYAEALAEYRKAYELFPSPALKFNMAQAARLHGESGLALRLYREYLAEYPDAPNREMVQKWIEALEDLDLGDVETTTEPTPDPHPAPETTPVLMPDTVDGSAPAIDPDLEAATAPPGKKRFPGWGVALVVTGVVLVLGGAAAGAVIGLTAGGPRFEPTELGGFEI